MKTFPVLSRALARVVLLSVPCLAAAAADAQLVPDRLYYGVSRPMPMQVGVPAGVEGEAKIELYPAGASEPSATAAVVKGGVDLASLFPDLWAKKSPAVQYAQLVVGTKKIGAPVVLRAMVAEPVAVMTTPQTFAFRPPGEQAYAGIQAYVDKQVVLDTDLGQITVRMRPDEAPNTCWNFMQLAQGGYYTGVLFHRIIGPTNGRPGFMAQVGDPTATGSGGPGYCIDLEPSRLEHDFGVLSMARTNDPNTNGSQIFVCFSREATKALDGKYCAFAQAVSGAETILKLEAVNTVDNGQGEKSKPSPEVHLRSAKLVDAPPYGDPGREPVKRPTAPAPAR